MGAGPGGTVQTFDNIDGGAGTDTLDLVVRGNGGIPGNVDIENVEIVNLIAQGANTVQSSVSFGGTTVTGVDANDFGDAAEEIWQVGAATNILNLDEGQTAGFRNATVDDVVYASADVTSVNVVVDNVADDSLIGIVGEDLTSATVSGSVSRAGVAASSFGADFEVDITNDANGDSDLTNDSTIETLNLALSSDVELTITGAEDLVTLNAGDSTGGIRLVLPEIGTAIDGLEVENATFGSGDDLIVAASDVFAAEEVSLDLGEGDDTLTLVLDDVSGTDATAVALNVAGGAGGDTFNISGGNVSAADVTDEEFTNTVTIGDFGGDDLLNLADFTGFAAQTLINNTVAAQGADASLFEVVSAIAALNNSGTNMTETAQFVFEGNTYVYQDKGTEGLNAGDVLVELTGVVTLDNDNVVSV